MDENILQLFVEGGGLGLLKEDTAGQRGDGTHRGTEPKLAQKAKIPQSPFLISRAAAK